MAKKLIISSMMRSGSTLLQHALNAHEDIYIEYQTKTSEFISFKKQFLKNINCSEYHILSHYSPQYNYNYDDFYSWSKDKDILKLVDIQIPSERKADVVGVKEVLIEEFYSVLIAREIYCLNIIRDPRDVVTSMSFGQGQEHTGKRRPILFDLRNWRKSVYFYKINNNNYLFKNILFEDLINNPHKMLNEIFNWLEVKEMSITSIIKKLSNSGWVGNSSFGDKKAFDPSVLGKYKEVMPKSVISYIEAICYDDMINLGYPVSIDKNDRKEIISKFKEPFIVQRPEFVKDYTINHENIKYEISLL